MAPPNVLLPCSPRPGIKLEKPKRRGKKENDPAQDEAEQSQYLLFLSRRQVDQLASLAVEAASNGTAVDKGAAKRAADTSHSVDVALFGRMVADATDLNVDAAAQVAHAISVHAVDNEFDYFTAVDDRAPEENVGAGMIGTIEFNSSTLYRYATVDLAGLRHNLGDDTATAAAVSAFVKAFVTSMPTGKQTTFAHRTLPDAVVVQLRTGQPVNLVGAFEDAVEADSGASRVRRAAERLVRHGQDLDAAYDAQVVTAFVVHVGEATSSLAALGEVVSMDQLVDGVGSVVRRQLGSTE
jgi:CRISPR system Cascade subunit CasC